MSEVVPSLGVPATQRPNGPGRAAIDPPGSSVVPAVPRQGSRTRRWVLTLIATAASAYAIDAVATTAGVLLGASHVLRGLDHRILLAALAGTYVLWGAGLRVNLRENWRLLRQTGMSTNVLSKAAYDLVQNRRGSARRQRLASAIGYAGTEIVKEAPYYVGAFGAVLLSDSVSSADALVFLAGANLGAAAYEYGLARVTRALLHRTSGGGR